MIFLVLPLNFPYWLMGVLNFLVLAMDPSSYFGKKCSSFSQFCPILEFIDFLNLSIARTSKL